MDVFSTSLAQRGWEIIHARARADGDEGCEATGRHVRKHPDAVGMITMGRHAVSQSSVFYRARNTPEILEAWQVDGGEQQRPWYVTVYRLDLEAMTVHNVIANLVKDRRSGDLVALFLRTLRALQDFHADGYVHRNMSCTSVYVAAGCDIARSTVTFYELQYAVRPDDAGDDAACGVIVNDARFCALSALGAPCKRATPAADVEMLCYVYLYCMGAFAACADTWDCLSAIDKKAALRRVHRASPPRSLERALVDLAMDMQRCKHSDVRQLYTQVASRAEEISVK